MLCATALVWWRDDNSGESREWAGARPELSGPAGYKDLGTALRPRAVFEQF